MKVIFYKYWWLVVLAIIFLSLMFFRDKTPFIGKSGKSSSSVYTENNTKHASDNSEENNEGGVEYIATTPVKFKAAVYKEIPIKGEASDPQVSPDGSRIVIVLKSEGSLDLAIVDLIKNTVTPLKLNFSNISQPSWNAEGLVIVFSGRTGNSSEIYTYEIENKKISQVTHDDSRNKYWPRFSPYKFDKQYRIAYSSEKEKRKDIWWVRANGENDMPLTFSAENLTKYKNAPPQEWQEAGVPTRLPTNGGEFPEWSPNGFMIIYKGDNGSYSSISYSYFSWWKPTASPVTSSRGRLAWAPNQVSLLEFLSAEHIANRFILGTGARKRILPDKNLTSTPSYFPDGKALVYTHVLNKKAVLSIEPIDDPLGDVANLWIYPYSESQQGKIAKNQLLFLHSNYDHIYSIYETEFYQCNRPNQYEHARPYLVTSDAVLETFYVTFAAFLSYTERTQLVHTLTDFAQKGYDNAKARNTPVDIQNFFLTGLILLKPDAVKEIPPAVVGEIDKINRSTGLSPSLFDQKIDYSEFLVQGKYERDKDLQKYFRAFKWFQVFKFNLKKESDVRWLSQVQDILNVSDVSEPLKRINLTLKASIGESRYYGPLTLTTVSFGGKLPEVKSSLPWVTTEDYYKIFPSVYTLDSYIFDELITHLKNPDTVGTADNPRLLPVGLDVMAAFGSTEAKKILIEELKEDHYKNYERKLDEVTVRIKAFPITMWDSNIYHAWLGVLNTLISTPSNAPEFTQAQSWKRKELNTALGSWVNLRYETAAYVHKAAAECGEAGYEEVIIGMPKGYVEPNPRFFKNLNAGFDKILSRFNETVSDRELRAAIEERIRKFQSHLHTLEEIAKKELNSEPISDEEYNEILYIGRTIEHFILLMNSVSPNAEGASGSLAIPDSIKKIVYVQTSPFGEKLYEGLGPANEINVIVPFFGKRQIVKGPVYSYYEFSSGEVWNNDRWKKEFNLKKGLPSWIRDYYEGTETRRLGERQ